MLSPSSIGLQPWKFLVVTDPATKARLVPASYHQSQVVDCSHFVVFAVRKDLGADHVEKHIDRMHELLEEIIREGIAAGEFAEQDPVVAARSFSAATVAMCHPQLVAQCLSKPNRATPEEVTEFAINALR